MMVTLDEFGETLLVQADDEHMALSERKLFYGYSLTNRKEAEKLKRHFEKIHGLKMELVIEYEPYRLDDSQAHRMLQEFADIIVDEPLQHHTRIGYDRFYKVRLKRQPTILRRRTARPVRVRPHRRRR